MALEAGSFIADLVTTNPPGSDPKAQGDDHLRLLKTAVQGSFPNSDRAFRIPVALAAKVAAYPIVVADENSLIRADVSGGAFDVTLPAVATVPDGWTVRVMKSDSSTNAVTVEGNAAETIDGAANRVLTRQYQTETYMADGGEFKVVSSAGKQPNLIAGRHTIWLPKGSWIPRTTDGPANGLIELVTNDMMLDTWDFDQTTLEAIQSSVFMLKSWDASTVTAQFIWTAAAGAGAVVWGLRGKTLANDEALDQASGVAQAITDTFIVANDLHISIETSAVTLTGAGKEELAVLEVFRDAANVADTLTADALLIGVVLYITLDAEDDT